MKVLIAYDGSDCSDAIAKDLTRAGLPDEVSAVVLSVVHGSAHDPVLAASPARGDGGLIAEAYTARTISRIVELETHAHQAAAQLRIEHPTWKIETEMVCGDPRTEMTRAMSLYEPELIVMGSHSRSTLGRLIHGSVAQYTLHNSKASVRIARNLISDEMEPPKLVVAVDGSEDSMAGVEAIAQRVWPAGTEARAVAVVSHRYIHPALGFPMYFTCETELIRRAFQNATDDAVAVLRKAGLDASAMVLPGEPAPVLIAEAIDWKADCIFLGAHGSGALARMLLGSVSTAVAAGAPCSVEVVRMRSTER